MREILFRGKRVDNGEWLESISIINVVGEFGCMWHMAQRSNNYNMRALLDRHKNITEISNCYLYRVIPETIGQFTGFYDKHDRKIFEGDICLCHRNINKSIDKKVFQICYDKVRGFWGLSNDDFTIDPCEFDLCEIIGNIHDNLEIWEGKS